MSTYRLAGNRIPVCVGLVTGGLVTVCLFGPVPGAELIRDLVKATISTLANLLFGGPEAGFFLTLPVIVFYVVL